MIKSPIKMLSWVHGDEVHQGHGEEGTQSPRQRLSAFRHIGWERLDPISECLQENCK